MPAAEGGDHKRTRKAAEMWRTTVCLLASFPLFFPALCVLLFQALFGDTEDTEEPVKAELS